MSTEQDRRKEIREEVATILAASKACKVAACAGDKFATKIFQKKKTNSQQEDKWKTIMSEKATRTTK